MGFRITLRNVRARHTNRSNLHVSSRAIGLGLRTLARQVGIGVWKGLALQECMKAIDKGFSVLHWL